jgi:hypothetical protein
MTACAAKFWSNIVFAQSHPQRGAGTGQFNELQPGDYPGAVLFRIDYVRDVNHRLAEHEALQCASWIRRDRVTEAVDCCAGRIPNRYSSEKLAVEAA